MKNDCMSGYDDLHAVYEGKKQLAIIYEHKTASQYKLALSYYKRLYVEVVRFGVVAVARDYKVVEEYNKLVLNRRLYTRSFFQYKMGKLLGYSLRDIYKFVRSDVAKQCTCTECGGELNVKRRNSKISYRDGSSTS